MIKKAYFILLSLLVFPIMVFAEDYVTITYDANDGSGRTKVVQLEKGDSYTLAGNDLFEQFDKDPNNPMNDKVINRWGKEPTSTSGFSVYSTIEPTYYGSHNSSYDFFNDASEITLYAIWEGREDISDLLTLDNMSGEAVQYSNGEYIISDFKDFRYDVGFEETVNTVSENGYTIYVANGIEQLSYYRLPKHFTDALPFYIKEELEEHFPLPIIITAGSQRYNYVGSYYIKDDILYIDLIDHGDIESKKLYAASNVRISFLFQLTWNKKFINNRWIYSVTITFNSDSHDPIEVYQKGKIFIKYIDEDTNEELIPEESYSDVLGVVHNVDLKEIDGYKLIDKPEKLIYEFDEEDQTIYFKYVKNDEKEEQEEQTSIQTENPNTAIGISIRNVLIILGITILFVLIAKLVKKKWFYKI